MNYFFVTALQAFLPVVLLCGLLWVRRPAPSVRALIWVNLFALTIGTLAGISLPTAQPVQLTLTLLQLLALLLFLLSQYSASRRMGYCWQALLVAGAAMQWSKDPNLSALTPAGVINTELLLNLSAVVLAVVIIALSAVLTAMLVRRLARWRWPLLLVLVTVLLLPLCGQALLLLMKLDVLGLTKTRLSFVAQVTNHAPWLNYLSVLALGALLAGFVRPLLALRADYRRLNTPIPRRQAIARYRDARRTALTLSGVMLVVLAGQLYWDLVASQPPRLSEAVPVTIASDGLVHIPLEQVRDGKLHRFVWVADDGKAVRFLVINRYPDRLRLGVVFDACLLCGDQGYIMEGNQVVCVACGVHIFIPSIGKAGGCNPIPIDDWRLDDHELTIGKPALVAGVNYFTTVITLSVTDPVDASKLTNTKAEYKYSYGGKMYFFASEANYNRFRAKPTQFVPAAAGNTTEGE
ncbi:Fe-S-containing protein [Acerihabitans sp. TG2]|uniref:Fe-S-containing protein n=1 Tax=Acerihabitans sp. TG2 TaxID=3096008 RepID=UPI002B230F43|nr:Fe-S-containing protein [Acerihabitans sp. TG2]MEA9389163.1 Fe-S-containing protein [Acerihabitans sp. TG2]